MNHEYNESNFTIPLLRIIGSPFTSGHETPENKHEALEIYNYAKKNKIGLTYLEALKNQEKLEEFELVSEYNDEQRKHNAQSITAIRIAELFNSLNVNYAIFKSIMPFPATPNDVDIIHFGSDVEYEKVINAALKSNYIEVKGEVDSSQRMLHDARECGHLNLHKKDVYDIDIYQKISASHVTYLDKRKIEQYVTDMKISGKKVKVLLREAELVAIIIHSIVPEMLSTLFVYYATLYSLKEMNYKDIELFITIAKDNNVLFSVKAHFSLVAELHKKAHGFVPENIECVLSKLGSETKENKLLLKKMCKFPHTYSLATVAKILLEKSKEAEFRRSAVNQIIYMLNPKVTKWVIYNIVWRRSRDTY